MLKLVHYLKNFRKQVILGPIFKLTEAVFELIVPLVMAQIIDKGIYGQNRPYIFKMGGILLLLAIIGLCCALTCQFFAAKASQGVGTEIRHDLFNHINKLSYTEIDDIGTPGLINRLTNDVNQLQLSVAMLIRLVVRAPFLVIGATVLAAMLDLKLSLIFVAAAVLIAVSIYLVMSRSIPFYQKIQKQLDKVSLITRENLSGVRVIRAFSGQKNETERFNESANDIAKTAVTAGKISALLNPLTTVIVNIAIILILYLGGVHVNSGTLTQGEITALVNYMTMILLALIVIANLVVIFTKASASADRVNEIFEIEPSVKDEAREEQHIDERVDVPKISFENVSFSYASAKEYALNNINLEIYPGETIGIIGGTGSGKSTLVNLISRFYDASEGQILIDGIEIQRYPTKQLRNKIGIVPQKAVLFSGTLRDNMKWRCQNASDSEIADALKTAQAEEFVNNLPNGYDTVIQQSGQNLSGGQKQRLTIARALIGNPEILILDDSASALDFATEAALRKALYREKNDMTVILVSQRTSTVKRADKIVVLDDGEIAGIGTHTELFESCRVYREICESQQSEEVNA